MSLSPKARKNINSQEQRREPSNNSNQSLKPSMHSEPIGQKTWLLKLGSRIDWQLDAVSSSPMILKNVFFIISFVSTHPDILLWYSVNFHLRQVFHDLAFTWTLSCWQHLVDLERWRETRAQSCLHRSPEGSQCRICLSASFKQLLVKQSKQWVGQTYSSG